MYQEDQVAAKRLRWLMPFLVASNYLTIPLAQLARPWAKSVEFKHGVCRVVLDRVFLRQKGPDRGVVGWCLGHLNVLSEAGDNTRTRSHELHHVEQQESAALTGLVLGALFSALCKALWPLLVLWVGLPILHYFASSAVSWLRGEDAYRGNHLEEGARAAAGDGCTHKR